MEITIYVVKKVQLITKDVALFPAIMNVDVTLFTTYEETKQFIKNQSGAIYETEHELFGGDVTLDCKEFSACVVNHRREVETRWSVDIKKLKFDKK